MKIQEKHVHIYSIQSTADRRRPLLYKSGNKIISVKLFESTKTVYHLSIMMPLNTITVIIQKIEIKSEIKTIKMLSREKWLIKNYLSYLLIKCE